MSEHVTSPHEDIDRFVRELRAHGVRFWIRSDNRMEWHSIAGLTLAQVVAINKHRAAITEIIRAEDDHGAAA
jgi:hypothetical protein